MQVEAFTATIELSKCGSDLRATQEADRQAFDGLFRGMFPPGRLVMGIFGIMSYEYIMEMSEDLAQLRIAVLYNDHAAIRDLVVSGEVDLTEAEFVLAIIARGNLVNRYAVGEFRNSVAFGPAMRAHWTPDESETIADAHVHSPRLAEYSATQLLYPLLDLHTVPMPYENRETLQLLIELCRERRMTISTAWLFRYLVMMGDHRSIGAIIDSGITPSDALCSTLEALITAYIGNIDQLFAFIQTFAHDIRPQIEAMGAAASNYRVKLLRHALIHIAADGSDYAIARALVLAGICNGGDILHASLVTSLDASAFVNLLSITAPVSRETSAGVVATALAGYMMHWRFLCLVRNGRYMEAVADALATHLVADLEAGVASGNTYQTTNVLCILSALADDIDFLEHAVRVLSETDAETGSMRWTAVAAELAAIPMYAALHESIVESEDVHAAIVDFFSSLNVDERR